MTAFLISKAEYAFLDISDEVILINAHRENTHLDIALYNKFDKELHVIYSDITCIPKIITLPSGTKIQGTDTSLELGNIPLKEMDIPPKKQSVIELEPDFSHIGDPHLDCIVTLYFDDFNGKLGKKAIDLSGRGDNGLFGGMR